MTRIDWTTVGLAAAAGLVVILAGALASIPLGDDAGSWVVWVLLGVALAGFALAGAVAGHRRPDTPMAHGALAAAVAFAIAFVVGVVVATARDRGITIAAIPVAAAASITAGVAGALLADLLDRRLAVRRLGR